ncbi:hypothetical protein EJ419_00490 [Alloscardovia theropitheci]|uniref:Primosomal protein N' 3' DNA-binding domain-containing protein n=1 Tax=Alloscardovia theropitheci TaxID=2496842 RepID=A0A4R0QWS4_9BIFI|nr:hypothetical protein [Alloscardovia theropitheci]TCD54907.1 hypothetical protein EJ419_00490 [Alloscardovia theropitheci]
MDDNARLIQQPALDGLAVKTRASSKKHTDERTIAQNAPATQLPIARVVLDVQTAHLGQFFDYIVPQKFSEIAQPGTLIRARFGNRRCTGVIWERVQSSNAPQSALKSIEKVLSPHTHISAHMRADIEAIATFFGGSRANIVRLAVPPRVAKVEQEISIASRSGALVDELSEGVRSFARNTEEELVQLYSGITQVSRAMSMTSMSSHIIWDTLPGVSQWERDLAWIASTARIQGRQVVMVLPDMRHVEQISRALDVAGFKQFTSDNALGKWQGNYVILNASLPAADRYRSYLAVAQGLVGCVIGTRAAMYAPVGANAVFISFHDSVYQNWDGFTPYPNVRDVLSIRAKRSNGIVINAGYVRSIENQWQAEHNEKSVIEVHGLNAIISQRCAWIRHLNKEELERIADPAIGARVPSVAVKVLRDAAERGPVLLSIPARSQSAVLCCSSCRKVAQCRRCLGPLMPGNTSSNGRPVCQWCASVAMQWSCRHCGNETIRLLHVGTEGTAQELSTLVPGIPIVISTPHMARGIVNEISDKPALVIATPGAEPIIRNRENGQAMGYQAIAIIDAWTSLYGSSLDQRIDTLTTWSQVAAMCVPRTQNGQVLILGEADRSISQALMVWDSRILSHREVEQAKQTGLPPSTSAALVWGERDSVNRMVSAVESDFGGLPLIKTAMGELPSVLGPVPKAVPQTLKQQYIDGLYQRVQCVIRVSRENLPHLVRSLHQAQARHTAGRNAPELHFQINPKNLM